MIIVTLDEMPVVSHSFILQITAGIQAIVTYSSEIFKNNFTVVLVSLGVFALCISQHHGSVPRGTPRNFDRNRGGGSKKRLGVQML